VDAAEPVRAVAGFREDPEYRQMMRSVSGSTRLRTGSRLRVNTGQLWAIKTQAPIYDPTGD